MPEISEYGTENALLPIVDALKGTRDWKDALVATLRRGGQNLGFGTNPSPEDKQKAEDLKSVMPQLHDPAQMENIKQGVMNFGEGGMAKTAMAGALRARGMPNLYAVHGSRIPQNPIPYDPILPSHLTSPSFSIKKYGRGMSDEDIPWYSNSGDSLLYVPRPGAVDPKHNASTIYNRDVWTQSGWNAEDRNVPKWPIQTQKFASGYPDEPAQAASIAMSPEFRSAKHYEESPRGAALLSDVPEYRAFEPTNEAWDMAREGFAVPEKTRDVKQAIAILKDHADAGNKGAQSILRQFMKAPSMYAEAKYRGNFGVTPERLAGVVLPEAGFKIPEWTDRPDWYAQRPKLLDRYVKALRERNIPFRLAGENQGVEAMMDLANSAAPFGGR